MKFNQLITMSKRYLVFFAAGIFIIACNNDKSANSSTPGTSETDTTTNANPPPVVTKTKKSGKVSTSMAADDEKTKIEKDKLGYYNRTEVLPAYNGGQSAIDNFINNNIEYPQDAIDNNVEGVVKVQFGVDENGNVSNVTTVGNKIGHGLEEEAIRVVSKMSKWTPGQVKGKNVKTWRTLPINYRLED